MTHVWRTHQSTPRAWLDLLQATPGIVFVTMSVFGIVGYAVSQSKWILLLLGLWFPVVFLGLRSKLFEVVEIRLRDDQIVQFKLLVGQVTAPVQDVAEIRPLLPRATRVWSFRLRSGRMIHVPCFAQLDNVIERFTAINPMIVVRR